MTPKYTTEALADIERRKSELAEQMERAKNEQEAIEAEAVKGIMAQVMDMPRNLKSRIAQTINTHLSETAVYAGKVAAVKKEFATPRPLTRRPPR